MQKTSRAQSEEQTRRQYVSRLVDTAPPLTPHQRDVIAMTFRQPNPAPAPRSGRSRAIRGALAEMLED